MADLKAKDYRRMFLEEIGFPLVKVNAQRFVSEVGDLRKVENLKLVFEAAMRWKSERIQPYGEREESLERELREKDVLLAELEERVKELEQQAVNTPAPVTENQVEPEVHLVNYLADAPGEEAQVIFQCFMPINDEKSSQRVYRKFAKFLHPDATFLPEDKAVFLFNVLQSSYQRVKDFAEEERRMQEFIDSDLDLSDCYNDF